MYICPGFHIHGFIIIHLCREQSNAFNFVASSIMEYGMAHFISFQVNGFNWTSWIYRKIISGFTNDH